MGEAWRQKSEGFQKHEGFLIGVLASWCSDGGGRRLFRTKVFSLFEHPPPLASSWESLCTTMRHPQPPPPHHNPGTQADGGFGSTGGHPGTRNPAPPLIFMVSPCHRKRAGALSVEKVRWWKNLRNIKKWKTTKRIQIRQRVTDGRVERGQKPGSPPPRGSTLSQEKGQGPECRKDLI